MKSTKVRNTVFIGVLAIIATAVAGWFFLIAPRLSEADEISAQASEIATSNVALQHRYNETLKQAASATTAASDAQALFSTMPQEADLPEVLNQITDAARRAGIKPEDISTISTSVPTPLSAQTAGDPAAESTSGVNLAQMQLNLTVSGKTQELLDFLTNLQSLDRAFLVSANQLTTSVTKNAAGRDVPTQTLAVTGSMFVLESQLPDLVAKVEDLLQHAQDAGQPT